MNAALTDLEKGGAEARVGALPAGVDPMQRPLGVSPVDDAPDMEQGLYSMEDPYRCG